MLCSLPSLSVKFSVMEYWVFPAVASAVLVAAAPLIRFAVVAVPFCALMTLALDRMSTPRLLTSVEMPFLPVLEREPSRSFRPLKFVESAIRSISVFRDSTSFCSYSRSSSS